MRIHFLNIYKILTNQNIGIKEVLKIAKNIYRDRCK